MIITLPILTALVLTLPLLSFGLTYFVGYLHIRRQYSKKEHRQLMKIARDST